jgi:hypothetical protein
MLNSTSFASNGWLSQLHHQGDFCAIAKKDPSISETLDWARALVALNAKSLNRETLDNTLTVLLKHEADVMRTRHVLGGHSDDGSGSSATDLDVSTSLWRYR